MGSLSSVFTGQYGPLGALDVHFISSLPVMQGNAYKTWVDSTPVQMVWAGNYTTLFPGAAGGGSD
jgi:hypothetical protein